MVKINEYKFNKKITRDSLLKMGFTNNHSNFLYYKKDLFRNFVLNIIIPVASDGTLGLDFFIVRVMNEYTFQPYSSFFNSELDEKDVFLNKLVDEYNKKMNELVKKGVLVLKDNKEIKSNLVTIKILKKKCKK